MTTKKLKLADIADLAGVSKSTVSFVLNGHAKKHRINEETVRKVEAIASEYNYSPSIYARALKSKQTYTAGLVIPDLANMGFAEIAKRLEAYCRHAGYQLLIASSEDDVAMEKQATESLIARQVDVLFVASAMTEVGYYESINKTTPVILFDRVLQGGKLTTVKTDSVDSTREVVAQLSHGQRECFYIGGQLELSPSRERYQGYQQGLIQAGLSFKPEHVYTKNYQPESGYQMMAQICRDLNRLPQAVFTASYSLLEGVLRYLSEHNALNDAIRVSTFDNYAILDCLPIRIDSVEQDCELIAKTLFKVGVRAVSESIESSTLHTLPAVIRYRR